MKTAEQWLDEYGESHRNHTNKLIHWICVPLIMFSVLGLLWSIPHAYLSALLPAVAGAFFNWATVTVVLASLFYLRLSSRLFVGIVVISAAMLVICYLLDQSPLPLAGTSVVIFVLAWIGQFAGHRIEGKKPSFFKDVQFLLIGPAWLLGFVYRRYGIRY